MLKIILHGCNGKMGQAITALARKDETVQIVAGIDVSTKSSDEYPVYADLASCNVMADVMIDFSNAQAAEAVITYCKKKKMPLVLCTTGLEEAQLQKVEQAAGEIAILKSANMSLGINVLLQVLRETAQILAKKGFDIEIIEKHHNQKVDAPSGTALLLAEKINEMLQGEYHFTYDRSAKREKRNAKEIGISAVRGGSIAGEHEVLFAGENEVLSFRHTAYSREIFAAGAIEGAKLLAGKKQGLYDMQSVLR